jgi:GTPase SAR1 family protein
MTNYESFRHVEDWMRDIDANGPEEALRLLVGNKGDLTSLKAVSTEEAAALAEKHMMSFLETSAKDDVNVEAVFLALVEELIGSGYASASRPLHPPLPSPLPQPQPQPPGGCC